MKKLFFSSLVVLMLCGVSFAETVEMKGELVVDWCKTIDGETVSCSQTLPNRYNIQIKLEKRADAPPYEIWRGSWIKIVKTAGHAFDGTIEVSKYVNTDNNTIKYRIDGSISHIPNDDSLDLDDSVRIVLWTSSMDELPDKTLRGNTITIPLENTGDTLSDYIKLFPELYLGSKE